MTKGKRIETLINWIEHSPTCYNYNEMACTFKNQSQYTKQNYLFIKQMVFIHFIYKY